MALRSKLRCLVYCLLASGFTQCGKEAPYGEMPDGMIALSFDDSGVDNWYDNLPLLDSLDIKATFYISEYHKMTAQQKHRLHIIAQHGNEIAYHTTNHADLVKLNKTAGFDAVLNREILPDLKLMRNDGLYPINFAYPYGRHDQFLDRQLLKYFRSVRSISKPGYYSCFARHNGERQVLYALEIDSREKISDDRIRYQMELAKKNNNCVLFYAHAIEAPSVKYQVTADRLRFLGRVAKQYKLQFVTTDRISN